jgi:hypothetical protein
MMDAITPLPALRRIRLELARTPEFPEGNRAHGYEFVAPVTGDAHIDPKAWKELKPRCRVSHFSGEDVEHGFLRHTGRGWRFDFGRSIDSDEPLFKLDRHSLTPGAYISITEHDGVLRPFRVVSVTPV